jgi:hypothetical protein
MIPPQIDALVLAAMTKEPAQRPATMEVFSEMIVRTLSSLPPDTVPSGPPTFASPAQPTPQSYSPYAPQPFPQPIAMPQPVPMPMPMPIPMPVPVPVPSFHGAPPKRGVGLWVALAIGGVVVIGGIAAATHRHHDEPTVPDRDDHEDPDPPDRPAPSKPDPNDPWNKPTGDPAFSRATMMMPVPADFGIALPAGFAAMPNLPGTQHYGNAQSGMEVVIVPLDGGTNDPALLAHTFLDQFSKSEFERLDTVQSGNGMRDAAWMTVTAKTGLELEILAVFYIAPTYRVGVAISIPKQVFARDPALARTMLKDAALLVHVP